MPYFHLDTGALPRSADDASDADAPAIPLGAGDACCGECCDECGCIMDSVSGTCPKCECDRDDYDPSCFDGVETVPLTQG